MHHESSAAIGGRPRRRTRIEKEVAYDVRFDSQALLVQEQKDTES